MVTLKSLLRNYLRSYGISPQKLRKSFLNIRYTFDEPELVARFFKQYRTSGTMCDVGVSLGDVSNIFLKMGWNVIGFEPDISNFKRTSLTPLIANDRFILDKRAVSSTSGEELTFFTSELSEGIASLHSFHSSHSASHTVKTVTLADALLEHKISSVNFVKIDTEGNDLEVLLGMAKLEKFPEFIVAEFDEIKANTSGGSLEKIFNCLEGMGYTSIICEWFPIQKFGGNHKFNRMCFKPDDLSCDQAWGNVIAIQKNYEEDFLNFLSHQPEYRFFN